MPPPRAGSQAEVRDAGAARVPGRAVGVEQALLPDSAPRADGAAAVDVGLRAVLLLLAALAGEAEERGRAAGVGGAVGVDLALLADGAGRAGAAAAVDIGLVAVLLVVGARIGDAEERQRVAGV